MFMHKSKKGFTIVELVIVIAVIAILAAVLIPTFSSLVKKANDSAYLQERTNQQIADLAEKLATQNEQYLTWEDFEAKLAEEIAKNQSASKEMVGEAVKAAIEAYKDAAGSSNTGLTEDQVKKIVEKALEGSLTTAQVESIVKEAVADIKTNNGGDLTAEINKIVNDAVANLNKPTGITKEEMENAVSKAISEAMKNQTPAAGTLTEDDIKDIVNGALAGFDSGLSRGDIEDIINSALGNQGGNGEVTVESFDDVKTVFTNLKAGDNVEIVISEDVAFTEELEVPEGAEVTLNLNGKSISSTLTDGNYPIRNSGELTIVGGSIENTVDCAVRNVGVLVLEDVTVEGVTTAVLSDGDVVINSGTFDGAVAVQASEGSVVINGGTFTNSNKDGTGAWGISSAVIVNLGADVTVNGGTFTASEGTYVIEAMLNGNIGTLEINGGTFTDGKGIKFNGEIEIHDGTFDCEIEAIGGFRVDGGTFKEKITVHSFTDTDASVDDRDVVIEGGNFTFGDGQIVPNKTDALDGTISGGTFNTTKDKLIAYNKFDQYVVFSGGSFNNN